MVLNDLMREAFSTCNVDGGHVKFMKRYNKEELIAIYTQFSNDLLSYNIPHWRVVGFFHGWDDSHQHSLFRKNDVYGMSLIELGMKMSLIIPTANGGIDPKVGCWYGIDEEIDNMQEFDNAFGCTKIGGSYETKRTNALHLETSEMGSLMCDFCGPPEDTEYDYMTTDNIWYTQFTALGPGKWPEMLIQNEYICDLYEHGTGKACLFMFIKKGTGQLDYTDTQKFFSEDWENIMPCRTAYDLSTFFTCAYVDDAGDSLRLVYRRKINESALTTILQEYGRIW